MKKHLNGVEGIWRFVVEMFFVEAEQIEQQTFFELFELLNMFWIALIQMLFSD